MIIPERKILIRILMIVGTLCLLLPPTSNSAIRKVIKRYQHHQEPSIKKYRIKLFNIPVAQIHLQTQQADEQTMNAEMLLKPPPVINLLSANTLGSISRALYNREQFSSIIYQTNSLHHIQKGRDWKKIIYHDDYMEYKNYREDKYLNTRDLITSYFWLLNFDFSSDPYITSTFNIGRQLYMFIGYQKPQIIQSKTAYDLRKMRYVILKIDSGLNVEQEFPGEMYVLKEGNSYVPVFVRGLFGIVPYSMRLMN